MIRRPVALLGALVLTVEAVGILALHVILGTVVDNQDMSLAGLDPGMMATGTLVGGILFSLYVLVCALVLALVGGRDRAPASLGRILLISAAVVHAVLGALSVGLVGWGAFAFMMVVLGMILFTLFSYDRPAAPAAPAAPAEPAGPGGDAAPQPA